MPASKYSKEYKIDFIKDNLSNFITISGSVIKYRCPVCDTIVEEYFSKTFMRINRKFKNVFIEDKNMLTCANKRCSQKQAQRRKSTREKIETTNIKKYGYKTFLETDKSNELSQQALINKYGSLSNAVKKGQETYYKKTGYTHNMRNPKSVELNQKHRVETIKNMTAEQKHDWYKKRLAGHETNKTKLWGGVLPKNTNYSRQQSYFFNELQLLIDDKITFGQNNEFIVSINDKEYYKLDGYIKSKNIVIEYNGDFWHANPLIYEANSLINYPGKSKYAKDVWNKDKERMQQIKHILNCKIIVVWENDYLNNKEKLFKNILGEING